MPPAPAAPAARAAACCAPLTAEPLSPESAEAVVPLLKALADPVRLRLVSLVAAHEGGEACVCDLQEAFDLAQPTISHHLKVLHTAGVLTREKRGTWAYYRVQPDALGAVAGLLSAPAGTAAGTLAPATGCGA
ncbi:metalloregulator ArsR/SmtB family transcription factor [Nocardioides sp. GY 10127]|uniref:ArsR/SmtB family transcription factor n=1 Tax=Nocardioides sp. GY 10127 TaxID=2569762 RepID=UPI0010A7D992|nr:metalloregulator ArsR/SmtB family transcription factor [Nocardioides sp. GY 10127]TIC84586.1 helix-turn-helix transcriptional regulator [Nocardioides sp. GY 10127]